MAQNPREGGDARIPGIDFDPTGGESAASGQDRPQTPTAGPPASYSMLEPRFKKLYGQFYKETYFSENTQLDTRTQELIAIACSVLTRCEGCLDGHLKKALESGATKEEISEAISIALGISAASIVDLTDRSAARLGLNHFPVTPKPPGAPSGA